MAQEHFLNTVGSLAQSVITDFICLEFYVQAGSILKISRHLNDKAENLNMIYPSGVISPRVIQHHTVQK